MIKSEISKELRLKDNKKINSACISTLSIATFTPEVAIEIREILASLKANYIKTYKKYSDAKDKIVSSLNKDSAAQVKYLKTKDDYENESLIDLVTNRNSMYKILDLDGAYIQKSNPVYLDPTDSNLGRAHFFAPRKKFLNRYYDTFWFNLCVIWGMSLLLGVTLYFDALKKFITMLELLFSKIGKKPPVS